MSSFVGVCVSGCMCFSGVAGVCLCVLSLSPSVCVCLFDVMVRQICYVCVIGYFGLTKSVVSRIEYQRTSISYKIC